MAEISSSVFLNLLLFLVFPLLGGYLSLKLKASPLVGYIVGGIMAGFLLGDKLPRGFISEFSMFGLILLVFTIGLETNFLVIRRFGRFVLVGGLLQLLLSGLFIMIFSIVFRKGFIVSLFFGLAFALSSTAVVAKIIQDRGEESSLLGGLAIGLLLLQDLALIPLLIIFSSFSSDPSLLIVLKNIVLSTIKAGLVLGTVYYLGQRWIPVVFDWSARQSREFLNLFTIVFIVTALFLFSWFGLSPLLAAFIAGVLLGQTLEHQHIFSQIRPYRDIFAVVFFTFLGMTVPLSFIVSHLPGLLLFSLFISLIKLAVVLGIFLFFHFHSRTAFSLAIYLFQIGEGAFIILNQAQLNKIIADDQYLFGLTTVLLTLLLTPFAIKNKDKIYFLIRNFIKKHLPFLDQFIVYRMDREPPKIDVLPLKNHVVICGYGRVGSYIGRALMLSNVPFIAVDYNFQLVEKARREGVNIIYGDPSEIDVLDYVEVDKASVLVSAVPDRFSQEMIVINGKRLNPNILIFTRIHRAGDQRRMKDLGVNVVIQPEFEASLSIIRKILLWKGIPREKIRNKIKRLKIEHGMG